MEIHKETRTIETILERIKGEYKRRREHGTQPLFTEPVPEPNKSHLLGFYRHLSSVEELSLGRIGVLLGNMYRVSCWLKHRPFQELTKDDIIDLIDQIKKPKQKKRANKVVEGKYSSQTVENYKQSIKKFWKFLNPQEDPYEYPPEVKWIRRKKDKNGLLPEDVWTPEEIQKLAQQADNLRDRAFILLLFTSGTRIREFLRLRRKDVDFDEHGCVLRVDGKTGARRVRVLWELLTSRAGWISILTRIRMLRSGSDSRPRSR